MIPHDLQTDFSCVVSTWQCCSFASLLQNLWTSSCHQLFYKLSVSHQLMYICNIIMWNMCFWIHHKILGMNFSSLLLSHICRVEKSKWSQTWKIGFVDGLLSIASSHVWFVFCGVCTQCMTLMKEGTSMCVFVMNEYNMVPNVSFAFVVWDILFLWRFYCRHNPF